MYVVHCVVWFDSCTCVGMRFVASVFLRAGGMGVGGGGSVAPEGDGLTV